MKRLAGAVTGTLLLALAAGGGASAKPLSVPARRKAGKIPELYPADTFTTSVDIDLNKNGFVCAFNLPQDPRFFQIIDDVAQVP